MRERKACKNLLRLNAAEVTFPFLLKSSWKVQGFRAAMTAGALYFGSQMQGVPSNLCVLAAGILLGSILNDMGWTWRLAKNWPLTRRITDWALVEKIAEGEEDVPLQQR